jgi:predicted DNA-binding transcriptional regulator AlpA
VARLKLPLASAPENKGAEIMQSEDDPVFTEPEMAKRLGFSLSTLQRKRRRGEISYIQLSDNRVGYRKSHGDALLDARTVKAKTVQS